MGPSKKNIFVFGADQFNLSQMHALDTANNYNFHELYTHQQVKAEAEFPVQQLLDGALERLKRFPDTIDAIVGYWDFPVSTMLPLLCRPWNLPSPCFEAVLKCEHKYWSRLEQSRVVAQYIPEFCVIDPFADDYRAQITVDYPFWIKPVKAAASHLGFMVRNDAELDHAIKVIRDNIFRFAEPFNYLLQFAELPEDIAAIDGRHCILESIISHGRQCTLEGYVYQGEVTVYGAVDSIREGKHRSCFARYQYPSSVPRHILREMISVTKRFLGHIGFDNGTFNIEFYWEQGKDGIWLLEINTRISKSHCPLFLDVDGAPHHKVMLELALGQRPEFPFRRGRHKIAAKFMWRIYENAIVRNLPGKRELRRIEDRFNAKIQLHVRNGMHLSSLIDQDSYSYEIAVIFLGGNSQKELLQAYHEIQRLMHIELDHSATRQRNISAEMPA